MKEILAERLKESDSLSDFLQVSFWILNFLLQVKGFSDTFCVCLFAFFHVIVVFLLLLFLLLLFFGES